jgi:PleD family two-component response regulator
MKSTPSPVSDLASAEDSAREARPARPPRILVVDDDPQVATMIGAWLRDLGEVHVATTSAQAFTLATLLQPDLAVVDVILPRTDGLELLTALRANAHLTFMAAIVITGSDRLDIPSRAADVGASTVLYKPVDEEVLRDTARALLFPWMRRRY